jgi:hypothetical protein
MFHAAAIENGIAPMGNEGAIEIGAEKANFQGHRECNLGFPFPTAMSLRLAQSDQEHHHDPRRKKKMKSAYELAMERLEKKAPSVALTDEQKKQIAEVDSQFKARIAEKELFLKDQIAKAQSAGNAEEAESLQKQLMIDVRRLQEDGEAKKEKLRGSFAK